MTSSLAKAKLCRDAAIRRGASPTSQPVQLRQACPKTGPHPTHSLLLFQRALRPPALTLPLPSSSCPCPRPSPGARRKPLARGKPSAAGPQLPSGALPHLTSDEIHVDQVGLDVPLLFRLAFETLRSRKQRPVSAPHPPHTHPPLPSRRGGRRRYLHLGLLDGFLPYLLVVGPDLQGDRAEAAAGPAPAPAAPHSPSSGTTRSRHGHARP